MKRFVFIFFFWCSNMVPFAEIKLGAIFTDEMVLQQHSTVSIWGWAAAGVWVNVV